ncbi:hypothetical protein C448_04699 [Halococcus morrhuae DSM 1307]|uniref:Uncharacterized protein n=1 Tax=Halococcus morrhuae DSM 1307 TaxID=931277 RepID=M0MQT2_HALMO|nr:Ig-like domain-containing protein [Halococcus morrhuae]EMA47708.1 hypothetical protein C448_04699 [Halococcus morrhuae DSM 1307]
MKETLKRRLQRFVDDERGVSPVVGFVLIFALVMIVFTLYQSSVVPAQNEEIEFKHSQEVEGEMDELSAAFVSTGPEDPPKAVSLQLGVQYPNRVLGINPGTPIGKLNSTDPRTIELASDDGSENLSTSFINYKPSYNLKTQETQYSIEHGMLVKDYSGSSATRLASPGALFSSDGEDVNLNLISGDVSANEMSTVVTTDNVDTHNITVMSDNITITLPTTLEEDEWNRTLYTEDTNYISQVDDHEYLSDSSEIRINLENGTEIDLNKVTTGDTPNDSENEIEMDRRITNVTPLHPAVGSVSSKRKLTVRTTDIFGSSLSGVGVNWSTDGSGKLSANNTISSDGNTTITYDPVAADSGSTVGITAELANASGGNSSVTFGLNYPPASGPPRCNLGSELESPGLYSSEPEQLNFEITPSSSVSIEKFSVITANDLKDVKKSRSPHEFVIKDGGSEILSYSTNPQTTPIIFNESNEYRFNSGPTAVNTSTVYIDMFDDEDDVDGEDDRDIKFESLASSCKDADVIVNFILEDGTERPVFIDATVGDDDDD